MTIASIIMMMLELDPYTEALVSDPDSDKLFIRVDGQEISLCIVSFFLNKVCFYTEFDGTNMSVNLKSIAPIAEVKTILSYLLTKRALSPDTPNKVSRKLLDRAAILSEHARSKITEAVAFTANASNLQKEWVRLVPDLFTCENQSEVTALAKEILQFPIDDLKGDMHRRFYSLRAVADAYLNYEESTK